MDVGDVPREIGALGMRLLEQLLPSVWPPIMREQNGRWIVCTLPIDTPTPQVSAHGTTVNRLTPDALVLVPPSRRTTRLHWLWSPRFPHAPLPEPWPILCALAAAAEWLQPWEIRADGPDDPRGRGRPAYSAGLRARR